MTAEHPTEPSTTTASTAGVRRTALQPVAGVVRRNLIHIKRMPEMLLDVTIQPVMFVLLFAFVFGGSIASPGHGGYREFLIAGIMAQTMAFSSFIVALGLTNDLDKGIVDRMRSLPIHRASVLVGRSISSLIHSSIGIGVMAVTGLVDRLADARRRREASSAYGLLLLFGFGMIWVGILVGSAMRSVEAVNGHHVHGDVPDDLRGQHLHPDRKHADLAAHDRRVEPDLGADPGCPRALGQRLPAGRCGVADAAPRRW